jgi:hypothetical protein
LLDVVGGKRDRTAEADLTLEADYGIALAGAGRDARTAMSV